MPKKRVAKMGRRGSTGVARVQSSSSDRGTHHGSHACITYRPTPKLPTTQNATSCVVMHLSDSTTESDDDSRKRRHSPATKRGSTKSGKSGSKKRKTKQASEQASSGSEEAEDNDGAQHRHVVGEPTYSTEEARCAFNPSAPGTKAWYHMTRHVSQCFRECINDSIPLVEQRDSMNRFVHLYLLRMRDC